MVHESIVTIKLGVSRITVAHHDRTGRIANLFVRKTTHYLNDDRELKQLLTFPERWGIVSSIVLVNVIPQFSESLKNLSSRNSHASLLSPSGNEFGLEIDYLPPHSLGVDRIAACKGALIRFPELSGRPFVVADFGSHTVLTLFRNGAVIGGSIASGIPLQLQSVGGGIVLGQYPLKSLGLPRRAIGRSTLESIAIGTILGAVRGVEGLFLDMCREMEGDMELILTGGLARLFCPFFRIPVRCDRHLIHYGAWSVAISGPFGTE
ncbi:MAG: type III pantothenate kinase [Leptospirales bacterium]